MDCKLLTTTSPHPAEFLSIYTFKMLFTRPLNTLSYFSQMQCVHGYVYVYGLISQFNIFISNHLNV